MTRALFIMLTLSLLILGGCIKIDTPTSQPEEEKTPVSSITPLEYMTIDYTIIEEVRAAYSCVPLLEIGLFPASIRTIYVENLRVEEVIPVGDESITKQKLIDVLEQYGFERIYDVAAELDWKSEPLKEDLVYVNGNVYVSLKGESFSIGDEWRYMVVRLAKNTDEEPPREIENSYGEYWFDNYYPQLKDLPDIGEFLNAELTSITEPNRNGVMLEFRYIMNNSMQIADKVDEFLSDISWETSNKYDPITFNNADEFEGNTDKVYLYQDDYIAFTNQKYAMSVTTDGVELLVCIGIVTVE